MVKLVYFLGLSKAIINILLDIESIHKAELGRRARIKQFLLKGVGVLPVVDNSLTIACTN